MKDKKRSDGLLILLFGCVLYALGGAAMTQVSTATAIDFRAVYYSTRSLLRHVDPYQETNLLHVYQEEGGDRPSDSEDQRKVVTICVNLPTVFTVILPFALLPWSVAHVLWVAWICMCLIAASYLVWERASAHAPRLAGILLCLLLFTSLVLVDIANTAGIVIGLCVIASWSFLRDRLVPLGIACLATSLIIKPHDAGFIWLYFLLVGGRQRKRALSTLAVAVLLGLPGLVWTTHIAPHWISELHTNLAVTTSQGGVNYPGPLSMSRNTGDPIINLQSVISVLWDNPAFYNTATYILCGILLALWMRATVRAGTGAANAWLALAAISALTMLPVYHRQHDARLLLLCIPACAMLWVKRGRTGWVALILTSVAILLNGDLISLARVRLTKDLLSHASGVGGQILTIVLGRPAQLSLIAVGVFYLWVYMRSVSRREDFTAVELPENPPVKAV